MFDGQSVELVPERVGECVEQLCHQGCGRVREVILALERNESVPGTEALNSRERAAVLEELREVMAPYGDCCPVERS